MGCTYRGISVITPDQICECVDGHLYIAPSRYEPWEMEMDDAECPCPLCNLDAWVARAHQCAGFEAHMAGGLHEQPQPQDLLSGWLSHPKLVRAHGVAPWASAARQGLLWTFLLPSTPVSGNTEPLSRVHWPWPLTGHTAHTQMAICAAASAYTPPPNVQQDAQGLWTSPLHPDDLDTWNAT